MIDPPLGIPSKVVFNPNRSYLVEVYRRGTVQKLSNDKSTYYIPEDNSKDYPRILAKNTSEDWIYRENVNLPISTRQRPKRIKHIFQHNEQGKWFAETFLKRNKVRRKIKEINENISFCWHIDIDISGIILIIDGENVMDKIEPNMFQENICISRIYVDDKEV